MKLLKFSGKPQILPPLDPYFICQYSHELVKDRVSPLPYKPNKLPMLR